MIQYKNRPGFTLLELIVYVGITALVVVSLTNVMITIFETRANTQSVSEVQQTGRFVMDRFTASFLNAESFTITASDRIVLNTPEGETVYSLVDGELFTRVGTGEAYTLTTEPVVVQTLTFTAIGTQTVSVELVLTDGNDDVMTLTTSYTLRQ